MLKKKRFLIGFLSLLIIFSGIYAYISSISISGKSDNGMWKYTYKKNLDESAPSGWQGKIKQLNNEKVNVSKLEYMDNGEIIAEQDEFSYGRAEDGSVTTANPFFTDFLLGDELVEGHVYKLIITYEKDGKSHKDTIKIK